MPTNGITDFELPYQPNKTSYFEHCKEIWGVTPRPNWEEMYFFGRDIGSGSNIFITNGQLDPWRYVGDRVLSNGCPLLTISLLVIHYLNCFLSIFRAERPGLPN
jgi:hypothetical protein